MLISPLEALGATLIRDISEDGTDHYGVAMRDPRATTLRQLTVTGQAGRHAGRTRYPNRSVWSGGSQGMIVNAVQRINLLHLGLVLVDTLDHARSAPRSGHRPLPFLPAQACLIGRLLGGRSLYVTCPFRKRATAETQSNRQELAPI